MSCWHVWIEVVVCGLEYRVAHRISISWFQGSTIALWGPNVWKECIASLHSNSMTETCAEIGENQDSYWSLSRRLSKRLLRQKPNKEEKPQALVNMSTSEFVRLLEFPQLMFLCKMFRLGNSRATMNWAAGHCAWSKRCRNVLVVASGIGWSAFDVEFRKIKVSARFYHQS
jgi:hypothetical protein